MIERLRRFFASDSGKIVGGIVGIIALLAVVWMLKSAFGESEAASVSRDRVFVCSETNKSFDHSLKEGETYPVYSPYSKKNTGWPAEFCYWTKDGKVKQDPTPVLLNEYLGKHEPTFCPDCGRLVVAHNPAPHEGSRPPPTKEQYTSRHSGAAAP